MADGRQKYMEDINIYGYMRVSSKEQNEDRQKIALTEMGVPEKNVLDLIIRKHDRPL